MQFVQSGKHNVIGNVSIYIARQRADPNALNVQSAKKHHYNTCHRMSYFMSKCIKFDFGCGSATDPHW